VLQGPQGALECVGILWNPLGFQKIQLVVSGYVTTLQGFRLLILEIYAIKLRKMPA